MRLVRTSPVRFINSHIAKSPLTYYYTRKPIHYRTRYISRRCSNSFPTCTTRRVRSASQRQCGTFPLEYDCFVTHFIHSTIELSRWPSVRSLWTPTNASLLSSRPPSSLTIYFNVERRKRMATHRIGSRGLYVRSLTA